MGIESLKKAAQAAGLAMAPAEDEGELQHETRPVAKPNDAWTYTGPRTTSKSGGDVKQARSQPATSVWSYLTGKATA